MGIYAGGLVYNTQLDTKGFKKGIADITGSAKQGGSSLKSIVAGLGIAKIIGKGIEIIKNSLDGAISRFDTMNNFPKVMENLGIGAKDSEKAIQKLSDGITGLPTTLDDAALAVEKFTSANSDVQKSTDIFLAANDAIVAGGASIEIQKNAMEQLSQAYAKGKPDMMEWRTLQTAMPGQLKQVATAMGYAGGNVAELGEDLRKGNVSMDKFMKTIVKLDKKGLPGFKSFSKQAQDSVGGIGTSMTNAKTAVVRGVTNMISALDKGMRKAKLGSIAENISKIGKIGENVLKRVGKLLENLPFEKIISAVKKLIPLIAGLVAGMTAYNTALKITATLNAVSSFASMINPIGLVVGSIGALIGAMTIYKETIGKEKSETLKNIDALKSYKTAMDDAKKAKDNYITDNMGEVSHYQELYNELERIVNVNGKIKKGYEERAKFIVTTLNEALGTEMKVTGNVIKNYDKLQESIKDVIEQKRVEVFMNAHEKEYNEAIKQKDALYKTYTSSLSEVNRLEKERKDKIKEIADMIGVETSEIEKLLDKDGEINRDGKFDSYLNRLRTASSDWNYDDVYKLMNAYIDLNNEQQLAIPTLEKTRKQWDEQSQTIYNYEKALGYVKQKNYDAVFGIWNDTYNYQGKTTQDTINNINKRIAVEQDAIARLKTKRTEENKDYIDSEIKKHEGALAELNKGKEKYKQAAESEQATIKGVWNQGMRNLIKDLTGKDVEFKRVANGNIQAYVNGEKQGKPMAEKEAKKVANGVVNQLNKAKKGGKIAGIDVIKGVDEGIKYKSGTAYSTIANFGRTLLNKLKSALKEHSPSKATREMGINLGEGLIVGVDKSKKAVLRTVDNFGNEILSKMQNAVTLETGNINASASLKANYGQTIVVNSHIQSDVMMDRTKVGQAVTPVVSQTLKKAGVK